MIFYQTFFPRSFDDMFYSRHDVMYMSIIKEGIVSMNKLISTKHKQHTSPKWKRHSLYASPHAGNEPSFPSESSPHQGFQLHE